MSYAYRRVSARVHLDDLETLAAIPEVRKVRQEIPPLTKAINVSEGDKTHGADEARGFFGVTGTGVKVCVLSDGVDSLAALQASGDLPPRRRPARPGRRRRRGLGDARDRPRPRARRDARLRAPRGPDEAQLRAEHPRPGRRRLQHHRRRRHLPRRVAVRGRSGGPVGQHRHRRRRPLLLLRRQRRQQGRPTSGTWEGDFNSPAPPRTRLPSPAPTCTTSATAATRSWSSSAAAIRRCSSGPSTTTSPPAWRRPTSTSTTWMAA